MKVDPNTSATVVIDMQNDFCHPDGELFAPPSKNAIENVKHLIQQTDDAGSNIVFTKDVHPEDQFEGTNYYDEFTRWGEHVIEGSWGAEIVSELDPDAYADKIIEKRTYDAFYQTSFEEWLQEQNIKTLVFCGTLANVCVLHTAGSAGLRDYKPIVIEDALGFINERDLNYSTEHIDWLFGEIASLDDIEFVE